MLYSTHSFIYKLVRGGSYWLSTDLHPWGGEGGPCWSPTGISSKLPPMPMWGPATSCGSNDRHMPDPGARMAQRLVRCGGQAGAPLVLGNPCLFGKKCTGKKAGFPKSEKSALGGGGTPQNQVGAHWGWLVPPKSWKIVCPLLGQWWQLCMQRPFVAGNGQELCTTRRCTNAGCACRP